MNMLRKATTAVLAAAAIAMAAPALADTHGGSGRDYGGTWYGQQQDGRQAGARRHDRTARHADARDWRDGRRGDYRADRYRWENDRDRRYLRHDRRSDWREHRRAERRWERRSERRHDWRRWRAHRAAHYRRWVGRRLHHRDYVVVRDYRYYDLPAPGRGRYYARRGDDVFLVAEASKRIIDAFVLLDAASR